MERETRTTIFFVRHGESVANSEQRICGSAESPLTDAGRGQARELAEGLRRVPFDALYTSPLSRARETAEILLDGRGAGLQTLDGLREQEFGEWEGVLFSRVSETAPEEMKNFWKEPFRAKAPGGESLAEFAERVRGAVFDEVLAKNVGRRVLCVCHGGTVRIALCLLLGLEIEKHFFRFAIYNATASIVRWTERGGSLAALSVRDATHIVGPAGVSG